MRLPGGGLARRRGRRPPDPGQGSAPRVAECCPRRGPRVATIQEHHGRRGPDLHEPRPEIVITDIPFRPFPQGICRADRLVEAIALVSVLVQHLGPVTREIDEQSVRWPDPGACPPHEGLTNGVPCGRPAQQEFDVLRSQTQGSVERLANPECIFLRAPQVAALLVPEVHVIVDPDDDRPVLGHRGVRHPHQEQSQYQHPPNRGIHTAPRREKSPGRRDPPPGR